MTRQRAMRLVEVLQREAFSRFAEARSRAREARCQIAPIPSRPHDRRGGAVAGQAARVEPLAHGPLRNLAQLRDLTGREALVRGPRRRTRLG